MICSGKIAMVGLFPGFNFAVGGGFLDDGTWVFTTWADGGYSPDMDSDGDWVRLGDRCERIVFRSQVPLVRAKGQSVSSPNVGSAIKQMREVAEMSPLESAGELGETIESYQSIEKGDKDIGMRRITEIAALYGYEPILTFSPL